MNFRRFPVLVAGIGLALASCSSGSDESAPPLADERSVVTDVAGSPDLSGRDEFTESDAGEAQSSDAAEPIAPESSETERPVDIEATPSAEDAGAEPVAPDAPEAIAQAEPVVGGRLFAADVQPAAQFDGNPFPDLVVEDVGRNAQVNIKNILPADRPVLLWAWAPH